MDLRDYIKEYIIDLPPNFLNIIKNEYLHTVKNAFTVTGIDLSFRNCKSVNISYKSDLNPTRTFIDKTIFNELHTVYENYVLFNPMLNSFTDTGYHFLQYEVGDFYKEHVDDYSAGNFRRRISCIILLNDDYEGGELSFFNNSYIIKPVTNKVIFFPSNFMYPHQVLPVTKGTRYSIVTWFM